MPEKPTGRSGPLHVSIDGGVQETIEFPTKKSDIEKMVMEGFFESLGHHERYMLGIDRIDQNTSEDDLDCTVVRRQGDKQMDLVEIAPLGSIGGQYENATGDYLAGDWADMVLEQIRKKAGKYGPDLGAWLLCYVTHWAFMPSDTALNIVRAELVRERIGLERVFFQTWHDAETARLEELYPAPVSIFRFDADRARGRAFRNFDNAKISVKVVNSGDDG